MKNHRLIAGLTVLMFIVVSCAEKACLENLRCEYQKSPIGIDAQSPRLSWEYSVAEDCQVSYLVEVAGDPEFSSVVWRSGEVESDASMVKYDGEPLVSHSSYYWRVRVKMGSGRVLNSDVQCFRTAMMSQDDWTAEWISDGNDKDYAPAPMLRKSFEVARPLASAYLYVSAAAYYKLFVNGDAAGNAALDPGYTDYSKTNLYSTIDLTDDLVEGENVLGFVLGNGFYNEIEHVATWDFDSAHWRERARMIAELHLTYADGQTETIVSDGSWKCATGPYLSNNIYSGEIYDSRKEIEGWANTGFCDAGWANAKVLDAPSANLVSQQCPPVRICESIPAQSYRNFGDTVYVFDFGKNISGVAALTIDCESDIKIKMAHGELLKDDGRVQMGNISIYFYSKPDFENQTDIYYTKEGIQTYEPSFTYHGFQYLEVIADKPVKLDLGAAVAQFIHTDVEPVGRFECSNNLINRINSASKLSYLDNLVSIPTDCPQREKNGWTADANLAIDLGLLNYDGIALYEKWIRDMIDSQAPDGNVPGIVPTAGWGYDDWIGPVWATAFFMIPQAVSEYYGDTKAIESIYDTCARYLEYLNRRLDPDGTVTYGIGDWVYYDTATPTDFSTSVFYYWQNVLMGRFSSLLGKDASPYQDKAAFLKDLINAKYFNSETFLYGNGSQAGQAMALMFDLVPEANRAKVLENLNKSIVENDCYLDFGSVGSKFVPRVLADNGYAHTVYEMLVKTDVPSWGAWIDMGLTTLAERWKLDMDTFRDSSANHVFLGDISAWMVRYLAGLDFRCDYAGNARITIAPFFEKDLERAYAEYHSVKGLISSGWRRTGGKIVLNVSLPANTTAHLICGRYEKELTPGKHKIIIKDE